MDELNINVRAGVAFALAIVCVGVALFILSYTLRDEAPEVEVSQVTPETVPVQ